MPGNTLLILSGSSSTPVTLKFGQENKGGIFDVKADGSKQQWKIRLGSGSQANCLKTTGYTLGLLGGTAVLIGLPFYFILTDYETGERNSTYLLITGAGAGCLGIGIIMGAWGASIGPKAVLISKKF